MLFRSGDKVLGRARCVEHAWQLRAEIRTREPRLTLGGWANPYSDPLGQIRFLADEQFNAAFYLTQIVSHLDAAPVERFLQALRARGLESLPGVYGVFFYRSANTTTLEQLRQFLPVPVEALSAEFEAGATPVEVCARTIRTMLDLGVRRFYVSNLPLRRASATLNAILEQVGA